jgi:hypothetical protein
VRFVARVICVALEGATATMTGTANSAPWPAAIRTEVR